MMSLLRGLLWETFYVVDKSLKMDDDDHETQPQVNSSEQAVPGVLAESRKLSRKLEPKKVKKT